MSTLMELALTQKQAGVGWMWIKAEASVGCYLGGGGGGGPVLSLPLLGLRPGAGEENIRGMVTWLILPVVICLSQRLSHACVSINSFVL